MKSRSKPKGVWIMEILRTQFELSILLLEHVNEHVALINAEIASE